MTMRTKGDLCGLTVRKENTYGQIDEIEQSAYAGSLLTLDTPDEVQVDSTQTCGSQVRGDVYKVSMAPGFTAKFTHTRGKGWEKWAEKVLGSLSGIRNTLPSFDTVFRVAANENHLMTGCRVSTFTMTAGNIGEKIEMTAKAVCRWHTITPFRDADGSTLTMEPVPVPAGVPVTYNRPWEWSTDGVNFTPIKGKGFALSIERSIASDPGVSSDSSDAFRLDAGEGSVPTDAKIRLDITTTSVGPEWDRLRLAFTKGITVKGTIDGKTVTLTGCYLDPSMPSRSQSAYDETVGFDAADMTVA